ncbi:hypothetical protein INR49_006448 [Caranx melampygus]|nr:hypothetical protein INR49_006444 [Caranx melampygus]KAG7218814.1 hypothetical protein INR49_019703 [Caranx melampygus]KAG7233002.1 hypothetical protein INR49_006448 [Caranx melampygus]
MNSTLCFNIRRINVGGEELTTDYYNDDVTTATPDYDYTFTFDYYYVTEMAHLDEVRNQAAVIGQLTPVLLLGLAVHHIWT